MKKILLGTTGLVGAALLATAASAETPKVTLGGFSDFQAGFTDNDIGDALGDNKVGFRNDNEISVRVDGKTSAGLGYGAVIDLEADITADNNNEGTNAARTFTYLEGNWGRVEMGGNKSAASTMRIDASTLAVATGGINGDWVNFLNQSGSTTLAGTANFITTSKLQSEHGSTRIAGDEGTYNATKITYYSPRYAGFQLGASYTPDLGARGQQAVRNDVLANDVLNLGLGYETQFSGGVKLALSATGEWADGADTASEDVAGYNFGGLVGFGGWNIAGSYGLWDQNGGAVAGSDGEYWTAGVGYDMGAIGLSATYLDSDLDGTTGGQFSNLVLGADYKLAPGLTPYAEVSFYDFDGAAGTGSNNEGTTVILGTQLAF